jgi:hypothetical protein
MRKAIFATVVVLLAIPSLGLAGDIDGVWWVPGRGVETVVVVRENAGTVLAFNLNLANYEDDEYDILIGQMEGNVCHMTMTSWSGVDASFTVTFFSATSATVYVNTCEARNDDDYCEFPAGVSFDLVKIF